MGALKIIRNLVRNGLYYLTEHADAEAFEDNLDIYDLENVLLYGRIRKTWPKEEKYEIIGESLDKRKAGAVCRITKGRKVRIITAYEDQPK